MERICFICGKPATKGGERIVHYGRKESGNAWMADQIETASRRAYCDECFNVVQLRLARDKDSYICLKKRLMLERAVRILENQDIVIDDYKEAIEALQEIVSERTDKFDSAHEIVAAIILLDNELHVSTQKKIGKSVVDFCIPSLKIVLEIDGYLHKGRLYEDNQRDIAIRKELGTSWEVVRIKTEYLEENAEMLVEAIKAIRAEKQKLRRENAGVLPEWYSKREKAKKPKRQNYGDEFLLS